MSEFIGSRISLISKSDIRYVGTLHEINSENSTVALEQVKSFGTEGRRGNPSEELAGSDSTYEYIVFRGSDVKDLRIEETPREQQPASRIPEDPAILGGGPRPDSTSTLPNAHQQQYQPQQPYGYPPFNGGYPGPRFAGQHGQQGGPPGPTPNGFLSYAPMPYGGPPPGYYGSQGHHMPPGQFHHSLTGPFGAPSVPQQPVQGQIQGQQEATKPVPARSEPNSSSGIQEKETSASIAKPQRGQKHVSTGSAVVDNTTVAPRPPIESKPAVAAMKASPTGAANGTSGKKSKIIPAMPLPVMASEKPTPGPEISRSSKATANAALQYQNATQAATAAVAAAMAKLPPMGSHSDSKQPAEIDGTLAKAVNNMRLDNRTRNGSQSERGGQRGGRGGRRGGREPTKPVEVPTTDFDFESANAKFNKQDLVKEAIATGSPAGATLHADGTADSASEAVKEVTIPAAVPLYDKSSFFDNISSEAKDREEAADGSHRPSGNEYRSEERKRNIETFGMGSVDNRFSGSRGRGRGRRGGYRGRGGFRGGRGALNVVQ